MSLPVNQPLDLSDIPTGEVEKLATVLRALLPDNGVLVVDVRHDLGCPCDRDGNDEDRCDCETVDVRLSVYRRADLQ